MSEFPFRPHFLKGTNRIHNFYHPEKNTRKTVHLDAVDQFLGIETKIFPIKETISSKEFEKIDIRVGTIESVEDIDKSDKLVRLIVDFGDHKRTILSGIKQERENPKEIEGIQAFFVVNLEPRKMMGELSEGMLLDIGYAIKV